MFSVLESRKGRRYGRHFLVMVKIKMIVRRSNQSRRTRGKRERNEKNSNIRSLIKSIDIDLKCQFIFVSFLSSHFFSVLNMAEIIEVVLFYSD
jgi:hypothetical protein